MSDSSQMRSTADYRRHNDAIEAKHNYNVRADMRARDIADQKEKILRIAYRLGSASYRLEKNVSDEMLNACRKLVEIESAPQ